MRVRRWFGIGVATALLCFLPACGDDDEDSTAGGSEAPGDSSGDDGSTADECTADRVGGEVTMGVQSETRALDPVVEAGTGLAGDTENAAIYDTLVRWDADAGEYVPHLAEALEPNADNSEWTLTLREGVTFGNGDPLDANAVKASVERHMDPANRSVKLGLSSNISEVRVVDDRTVVFELTGPWTRFPYLLAGQVGMITNPRLVAERGADFATNPAGAGAGPFEFVRFAPGEEIVLRAKTDYWGGPVCIETLRFVLLGDAAASFEGLQADTVDVVILTDAGVVDRAKTAGYDGPEWLQNMGGQILINNGVRDTTPVTKDVRIRQAVAHAIDPEVISERAFGGKADSTSAIFAEGSRYYQGLDGPEYDPAKARALVDEVKAEGTWDGTIRLLCANTATDVSLAVATMLEAVGFTVARDSSLAQSAQIAKVITEADYDLACWGNNMFDDGDPWAILESQLRSDVASNYRGYASPEWDTTVRQLKQAKTLDETKRVLAELQEIWNETIPSMNYRAVVNFAPMDESLKGVVPTHESVMLFGDAYVAR